MNELALFAGAGGGLLASRVLGWRTRCAVEIDSYCQRVLLARQRDGHLEKFPIWDDVRNFDCTPWAGKIDIITGGFPCQDISSAGRGAGITGERSGLWKEFARIISEVRPRFAFIENSPLLRTRGLRTVLTDLANLGFDARWGVFGARHVGAPHQRDRMWIVAHSDNNRKRIVSLNGQMAGSCAPAGVNEIAPDAADANGISLREQSILEQGSGGAPKFRGSDWWPMDFVSGVDDGVANRLDRVRATGNGQVPTVAVLAWRTLSEGLI